MILIPNLVPTRDIVIRVARLEPGTVLRADEVLAGAGGKPANVARLLAAAGVPCQRIEMASPPAAERADIHILDDNGRLTVINAPAVADAAHLELVFAELSAVLSENDLLVVAGRQPTGAFARLAALASARRARLVVDTSGADLRAALAQRPWLVKVNAAEYAEATRTSPEVAWSGPPVTAPGPPNLVLTHAELGARAWPSGGVPLEAVPPTVRVVNPLGAGDALLAGVLAELESGAGMEAALRTGVAWSADLVTRLDLSVNQEAARSLRGRVQVRPLTGG